MAKGGEGTAPEGWVQCGSHPAALPSAAPEVENALSLQKSQDVLDVEEEKMTVREQLAVCDIRVGRGRMSRVHPLMRLEWGVMGRGQSRHRHWGLSLGSTSNCPPPTLGELSQVTSPLGASLLIPHK